MVFNKDRDVVIRVLLHEAVNGDVLAGNCCSYALFWDIGLEENLLPIRSSHIMGSMMHKHLTLQ